MTPPPVTIRPANVGDGPALRTLQSELASPWPDLLDLAVGDQGLGPTCLVADGGSPDCGSPDCGSPDRDPADHPDRDGGRGVVGYVLALDGTTDEAATDVEPDADTGPTSDAETAVCQVVELVVAPHARRRGIGSALIDALAARTAADRLWLTVRADAAATQAFYVSQGFSETGRRTDHYEIDDEPTDAIVMARPLR